MSAISDQYLGVGGRMVTVGGKAIRMPYGIDGAFNLRYGTLVTERDGFLFVEDRRKICSAMSENGWEYFRPNTPEDAYRQEMLVALYQWYGKHSCGDDFSDEKWPDTKNGYRKNRLRTASTERLRQIYFEKFGRDSAMNLL